jgi:hypothetical protein
MERNSNENFEHFLRQNAEDFRMHPSPKVWEGISENLNKKKRKFYFGLIALLISASILGYAVIESSTSKVTKTPSTIIAPGNTKTATTAIKTGRSKIAYDGTAAASTVTVRQGLPVSFNKKTTASLGEESVTKDGQYNIQKESVPADLFSYQSKGLSLQPVINESSLDIADIVADNKPDPANDNIKPGKTRRLSFMFFFTPTVSYRKLSENKSYLRSPSPLGTPYSYAALYDINSAVTHKPSIGLELGFTSKYTLIKNVKLRAGVQFNINRYDIKAFRYSPEVAAIALNAPNSGVQIVSAGSNYRNFNGGQDEWLQNFYFQVSAPIGAEIKLHGNDKMYIGAASTIQPTYVLGDQAYLITSDYKNYAEVPSLVRRWNVNTNLETFVAYSTGKLKWQVGPQVRYQLLSSFVNEYPVKENLFDFGLKVGISANTK